MKNIAMVVCFFLIITYSSVTNAYATEPNNELEDFVKAHVQKMINEIPNAGWTADTKIYKIRPTFNADVKQNGYIISLITDGFESGYIQIGCKENKMKIISFAFEGAHPTDFIEDIIYYLGNMNYAYQLDDNQYGLIGKRDIRLSADELKKMEVKTEADESTYDLLYPVQRDVHTLVPNFDSSVMVIMNDFISEYDNHCGPTAATSLIKYLGICRNMGTLVRKNGLVMDDEEIFSELFTLMESSIEHGTTDSKIAPGLEKYMRIRSVYPSRLYYSKRELNLESYKVGINDGIPLIINLYDPNVEGNEWDFILHPEKYSNHTVLGVGYVGTMAIIMNGYQRTPVYVSFDEFYMFGYYELAF